MNFLMVLFINLSHLHFHKVYRYFSPNFIGTTVIPIKFLSDRISRDKLRFKYTYKAVTVGSERVQRISLIYRCNYPRLTIRTRLRNVIWNYRPYNAMTCQPCCNCDET